MIVKNKMNGIATKKNEILGKFGLHGLSSRLRYIDYLNENTQIRLDNGQNKIFVKNYSKKVPLNRMADKKEIVGAMLYLASDASSYVTGQNIFVDGGISAW